ncbi:hypothetical protein HRH25_20945 [Flavisolibacter sp. BT320]|nr:hypothetical protein [Flavisolibacter longurius]
MKRERTIICALFLLQLLLWLGFFVHRSPRFPGSLPGGLLAISAALLMVVPPLLYSAAKRINWAKEKITKRVSLGTLLTWHVYTSIIGAILAILHTGHRFESSIGIWLTTFMLLTVLSGFVGRYYLNYSSTELREKKDLLNLLATEYNRLSEASAQSTNPEITYAATHGWMRRALNSFTGLEPSEAGLTAPVSVRAIRLTEAIADVEYAIKTHEVLKRRTARWLIAHIVTSCAFYLLLIIHIWSAIYFGLRYFK